MADVIRHRPGSRSPHDSLDSHDDSSSTVSGEVQLTMEQIREECQRLRRENSQYTMRLLGVNELARLLQEKTEACDSLQDKSKRLEIAVVRLENRCSNFERKLRSQTSTSLPSGVGGTGSGNANPKPAQSPFIPGPSRQILESLLKENAELKRTINTMAKRGPTGYMEAVKMTQLEEELDQKNSEIEHLKKQLDTLTAPQGDEDAQAWMNDPKLLQRQLMKMQQSMRIKDRFCSLLSDRIGQVQKELNESRKVEGVDGQDDSGYPQSLPSENVLSAESGPTDPNQTKDLHQREKKLSKMLAEAQKKLEIERKERTSILSQAQEHVSEINTLKKELDEYQNKLDNLSSFNETLLEDKSKLKADLESAKSQQSDADAMMKSEQLRFSQAMSALKLRHSRDLDDKNQEIKRLNVLLEDAQFKFAVAESKISQVPVPQDQKQLEKLEEEIQTLQSHNQHLHNTYQETRMKYQQLYSHYQALAARVPQTPASHMRTGGLNIQTSRAHEGSTMFKGMEGLVDGGKTHPDTKTNKPPHGSVQNAVDTVIRHEILSRGDDPKMPDDDRTSQPQNKPVTLPISGNQQRSLTNAQTQPQTPHTTPTPIVYHKPVTDIQAHAQAQAGMAPPGQAYRTALSNTTYGGSRAHSPGIPPHSHVPGSIPISSTESVMIGGGAMYPPTSQSLYNVAQQFPGYQPGGSLPPFYRQQQPPSQRYMELFPGHSLPPSSHPPAMTPGHSSGMPPAGGGNSSTLPNRRHSPPNYMDPRYHHQGGPHQGGPHQGPHQGGPH